MKVAGAWRRTIERDGPSDRAVHVLDQAKLPYAVEWLRLATLEDCARAIRDMHVRGAPLIGVTAAYGVAIARAEGVALDEAIRVLAATRPTAINLRWALERMRRADDHFAEADRIAEEDVALCAAIGEHGVSLVKAAAKTGRARVLTHCNAGWLATVDWGTALAPIYKAHEQGIDVHVWVDETRPRNQGLLTAWELAQHGVPHTVIADNAGGHLMQRGEVDLCIVGTDRTTRSGDVCNKIGTYLKALAAHDNGVPFYAAVPSPSIDWTLDDGAAIPIEERSGDEVRFAFGREVVPAGSPVANPAFDVTPRRLVTGLVTERGVAPASADGLRVLFPEHAR
jgi:methylthioribose-1-phosphate isomerase